MNAEQMIGAAILAAIFLGLAVVIARVFESAWIALGIVAASMTLTTVIFYAAYLLTGEL